MFRFVQRLFSSMSLERKSLLFFGFFFTVLMCGAFFVVQTLGNRLVLRTTQQRAQDLADAELMLLHSDAIWADGCKEEAIAFNTNVMADLRSEILAQDIQFEILGLEDKTPFVDLPPVMPPEDATERERLEALLPQFREQMAHIIAQDPEITESFDLGENESMSMIGLGTQPIHQQVGPVNGSYIYYRPIFPFPKRECSSCHYSEDKRLKQAAGGNPIKLAELVPFRVIRVTMPYKDTEDQTTWVSSIVVALALFIVAMTLYMLHALIRYLVLEPLYHIRDVSEAITHGDVTKRATIESEDEFRELADAFNRMLRGMLESQEKERIINAELDARVDQLAQLNWQLYEANRVKSDFMANMSHELRTPLNSIIGFSEVLHGIDALTDKQRRYAENIQKSGRLLLEMINDILDLAKVEAGKMEVRRNEFDLGRLIAAQADMIGSLSEEKHISLTTEIPEKLPLAYQDPNKLGQIINNLLSNAIKFTPEGGKVTICVEDLPAGLSDGDSGGERFRMLVIDTGVGIAEEDQSIIFQKFRQSRKVLDGEGLTREFAGTGLGLSIVKELAKLLGGEVGFESELGRGSTFWVELPWRLSDESLQAANELSQPPGFQPTTK
ncbi:sensor histidine kinase [Rhodopirellula sp. MGV]|uniref:sensor histidine kinase n=1 Tax=Rhodopirellula sp. MGV TaxID=2023130 RepID=UPI000B9715F2|nr:ATP-binding protein [Rhodopirellula sp. MGV]OYP33834.1 two-component sensor histidine kinase [Rhodopirellula sp. MGV]PNY37103.1 HAMP domain-containing protein [Rhodopirellula baltica]